MEENKNKGGRPPKYDAERVEEIKGLLSDYIDNTDIPILAEFAYKNDIPRHSLYDYDEFSTLIKKAIDKKESGLERLALEGKAVPMCIFSLKQLGWKDRQEITGKDGEPVVPATVNLIIKGSKSKLLEP